MPSTDTNMNTAEVERQTLEAVAAELAQDLHALRQWILMPNRHTAETLGLRSIHLSGGSSQVQRHITDNAERSLMAARYIGLIR